MKGKSDDKVLKECFKRIEAKDEVRRKVNLIRRKKNAARANKNKCAIKLPQQVLSGC